MSTDNADQPAKRKSVADMWREREQAMLEKQQQPIKAASPPRRSFRSFEEKKIDDANAGADNSANTETGTSSNREGEGATNTGESSTTRRPVSTKSKFAMMGQKHAARPKKLPTGSYQQYQQQANRSNDPKSPDSANSDALLAEAFDDAVAAQEGKKHSTSRRSAPQSDGVEARASEYSSLQVSDSASIPQDVKHANDDESNISGLSSPGSPARSSRNQRRSNAILEETENDDGTLDSEGYSAGSTVSPVDYPSNYPENLDDLSVAVSETLSEGMEAVTEHFHVATEAVVKKEFVKESDKEVSAFQDAIQKVGLEDIANDMKEEANALFAPIGSGISKMHNDLNESMVSASEKFSSLFAKKEEEPPAQAENSVEVSAEGDVVGNSETPENEETNRETADEEPATETTEAMEETTEPLNEAMIETVEPSSEAPTETDVAAEPAAKTEEGAQTDVQDDNADDAPDPPLEAPDPPLEAPDPPLEAPEHDDPPLEAADSSEVFDPFASGEPGDFADFADFAAFPDDTFSSNFAAPVPAPTPAEPVLPMIEPSPQRKPVRSPARRKAPAAHEEVAIEVEYLDDSDDDQADV